jgi:hypothetical protein
MEQALKFTPIITELNIESCDYGTSRQYTIFDSKHDKRRKGHQQRWRTSGED